MAAASVHGLVCTRALHVAMAVAQAACVVRMTRTWSPTSPPVGATPWVNVGLWIRLARVQPLDQAEPQVFMLVRHEAHIGRQCRWASARRPAPLGVVEKQQPPSGTKHSVHLGQNRRSDRGTHTWQACRPQCRNSPSRTGASRRPCATATSSGRGPHDYGPPTASPRRGRPRSNVCDLGSGGRLRPVPIETSSTSPVAREQSHCRLSPERPSLRCQPAPADPAGGVHDRPPAGDPTAIPRDECRPCRPLHMVYRS